jgi:hypothetical protein
MMIVRTSMSGGVWIRDIIDLRLMGVSYTKLNIQIRQ